MEKKFFAKIISCGLLLCIMLSFQSCSGPDLAAHHVNLDIKNVYDKPNVIPMAIIGSGPAGLCAGIYGARGLMHPVIFEGIEPGGLLTKTTHIENWAGEISILGPELIAKIRNQAMHLGVTFVQDVITAIDTTTWPYKLTTQEGLEVYALTVILATGATPRMLGVPGEQEYFQGKGVSTCAVCDAPFTKGEDVLVVGGGDSAIEEALQLAAYAKKVTVLVRKEKMRAAPRMQERLKDYPTISVRYNCAIEAIIGNEQKMTGVQSIDTKTNERSTIEASRLFLAIGHDPNSSLVKGKVAMDEQGYIITQDKTQLTTVAGIFAAGEVEDNRYRQAMKAAGQGVAAGLDALALLSDLGVTPESTQKFNLFSVLKKKENGKHVEQLTSLQDFQARAQEGYVLLDFFTQSCSSCKHMLPRIEELALENQSLHCFKIDADQAIDLAEKFYVFQVPCLIFLHNGKLLGRVNEALDKQELQEFIKKFIA